ncbi:ABC transporter permease subunit [Acidimangrovimonas sediminis]|uniref:ABC transporter permease subunit n=1 Tax=Acidimangrovimonas sediminis TaxID=2056283 RepID=UPI000C8011AB|nr:ABC transporter permease subunit [Acidimangrovimonas sediminis]
MLNFIVRKIAMLIPTLFGITIVSFGFIHLLPGDPVTLMAGDKGMTVQEHAAAMARLGLDRPLWQQYLGYLGQLAHGNLGTSLVTHRPVLNDFLTFFPATLELSICAMVLAVVIGMPLGVLAAVKRGTWFDQLSMSTALVGYSMPIFWWGLLLIVLFAGVLHWAPVSGRISLMYYFPQPTGFMLIDSLLSGEPGAFRSAVAHLALPSIVLATVPMAVIARQSRSAMLEVLGQDYVRTARAKGLAPGLVVGRHALRNALIPVVTVVGLQVGALMTGAILTETIFSWPGIGKWIVDAISSRDYPVVQSGLLVIATMVMLVNLVVDILYAVINPRIRHA